MDSAEIEKGNKTERNAPGRVFKKAVRLFGRLSGAQKSAFAAETGNILWEGGAALSGAAAAGNEAAGVEDAEAKAVTEPAGAETEAGTETVTVTGTEVGAVTEGFKCAEDGAESEAALVEELLKNTPVVLGGAKGFIPIAPPDQPKTLAEAGRMALRILKKG